MPPIDNDNAAAFNEGLNEPESQGEAVGEDAGVNGASAHDADLEGYQAFQDEKEPDENPYVEGTAEYDAWAAGWNRADAEANPD